MASQVVIAIVIDGVAVVVVVVVADAAGAKQVCHCPRRERALKSCHRNLAAPAVDMERDEARSRGRAYGLPIPERNRRGSLLRGGRLVVCF